MRRRPLLVLATIALIAVGLPRYSLAVPTELEADAYGGQASGGWTCGPRATATYAGAGMTLKMHPLSAPTAKPREAMTPKELERAEAEEELDEPSQEPRNEPSGLAVTLSAGGEHRSFDQDCSRGGSCDAKLPPPRLLVAGRADVGGDWKYFGFRVGSMMFQRWSEADATGPVPSFLPTADFRFGRRTGLVTLLGFGAFDVPTLFRPGLYTGVGYLEERGFGVELRVGGHLVFDDQVGVRGGVRVRYAIDDMFAIGLGGVAQAAEQLTPEGSLFLVLTP